MSCSSSTDASRRTRALLALLRSLSLRHALRSRTRTALTLFGVSLGIATLVAIDVVNASSSASIDDLVTAYAGRAALTITAGSGTLPRDAIAAARGVGGVTAAAGSIQSALLVGPERRTALPFIAAIGDDSAVRERAFERGSAPGSDEVALGREAARRLGADVGGTVPALTPSGLRDLRVSGVLAERGLGRANATFVALLDPRTADAVALKGGRIDAIDVAVAPNADLDRIAAALRDAVPGANVETAAARGAQTKKLIALLQDLLRIVSALALFIGTFLVFNTMSTAVAQRRQELGIARALGARRRDVLLLVAVEALVLGTVASLIGVVAGTAMARGLLGSINEQIRATYIAGLADQLVLAWPRLGLLALAGIAASLAGALVPAVLAARVPVREAVFEPPHVAVARPLRLRLLVLALLLGAVSVAFVQLQRDSRDTTPTNAAVLALMLAIATAASPLLALAVRAVGPVLDRAFGPPARLARDSVLRRPGRAAVTAAALAAGVTMVVGLASFIESDRRTVFDWLDSAVNADLFVSATPLGANSSAIPLDPAIGDRIAAVDGVRSVDRFRQVRIRFRESLAALSSVHVPTYLTRARPLFAAGTSPIDLMTLVGRDDVVISENLARREKLAQGDTIALPSPDGPRDFRVAAVMVDYTTDQGLIFMDRGTYVSRFHDSGVDSFAVMIDDRAKEPAARRAIEALEGGSLEVRSNAEFKAGIRKLVDDYFATTYLMEAIALVVGVLGVANTMLVAIIERRREIGVLRAVGASRAQIRRTVLIEAAAIGTAGALLGLGGGAALAAMTIVVSESTSGWVIPYHYEWSSAITVTVLSVLAALLAGWWPARSASRQEVAAALAYE